jgi:hypothetical protein
MPVHIEEMQTDVTVFDGDLPLSPEQIEKLVKIVIRRLEEQQQNVMSRRQSTEIRNSAIPQDKTRCLT